MNNFIFINKIEKYLLFVIILSVFLVLVFTLSSINVKAESVITDHTAAANFESIPDNYISFIHDNYHIYYGHTSHGSQIMSGLYTVEGENASYDPPVFHEVGDDLGHNGDVSWEPDIRQYLDNNPDCNMVMMSWCGGCSDNSEEGINIYLNAFNQLELDYPDVIFIYMTGHLDGTGVEGNLYARNNQIRAYCMNNDKVLFDFADIESWDPDGNYYPDDTDYCNWCTEWCKTHECPDCGCAHSQCFNCYLKGKAWWWMMARVSGWNGTGGDNQCPEAPTIIGSNSGKPGEELMYVLNALDPDEEDEVRFFIDWGDGDTEWTPYVQQGTDKAVSHIWSSKGDYNITVYGEDEHGLKGSTSTKQVTIPRSKAINRPSLKWLQSHLFLFPLLQKLIQNLGL